MSEISVQISLSYDTDASTYAGSDDIDCHRQEVDLVKDSNQTDILPGARPRATYRSQEDLSIEGFLSNDALYNEPKRRRSKLGLGSSRAANVYIDWSFLKSGFRNCIDKSKIADPLPDEIVRNP